MQHPQCWNIPWRAGGAGGVAVREEEEDRRGLEQQ